MNFAHNVNALPQIAAAVAVIAFLAAGFGYLRWARSQSAISTIKLLNEEIGALKLQNARLEADNRVLNAKLDEQSERLKLLTETVTGLPAWRELSASINALTDEVRQLRGDRAAA